MSDIKVGHVVDVSHGGHSDNYSGRGHVTRLIHAVDQELESYAVVAPLKPQHPDWTEEFSFPLSRVTLAYSKSPASNEGAMLGFESGATRNRKEDELQYEGFISPLALKMYAEYMHANRVTADGSVRASDNWQKGIPDESYRDSLLRHVMDLWLIYRGWEKAARDGGDVHKALAGAFFNLQGLMHNLALRDLENEEVSQ